MQVKNTVVAHNTIVNVAGTAFAFDWGIGASGRTLLTKTLRSEGNLISSTAASLFEDAKGIGYTFANNIVYDAALGILSRPQISEVDPRLALAPDAL